MHNQPFCDGHHTITRGRPLHLHLVNLVGLRFRESACNLPQAQPPASSEIADVYRCARTVTRLWLLNFTLNFLVEFSLFWRTEPILRRRSTGLFGAQFLL